MVARTATKPAPRRYTKAQKDKAEALWSSLAEAFANLEAAIDEIIETKAWLALGYPDFASAWDDRMKNVPVSIGPVQVRVIYQMLDEGRSEDEVAKSVKGIGPATVKGVSRHRKAGVPRKMIPVRKHERRPRTSPKRVAFDLEPEVFAEHKDLLDGYGYDIHEFACEAYLEAIEVLRKPRRRRRAA